MKLHRKPKLNYPLIFLSGMPNINKNTLWRVSQFLDVTCHLNSNRYELLCHAH